MQHGIKLAWFVALTFPLWLDACGHWPPVVDNAYDVRELPSSQGSIRARALPDNDIATLERLAGIRILDFGSGWAGEDARITDEGLARLSILNLPQLWCLDLGYCGKVTDAGLLHIGRMRNIRQLALTACPRITDAGLPYLLSMPSLKSLDLRGCPGITDQGLQHLAAKGDWETIRLGGCPNVTQDGVTKLQAVLPKADVSKDEKEWLYHQQSL